MHKFEGHHHHPHYSPLFQTRARSKRCSAEDTRPQDFAVEPETLLLDAGSTTDYLWSFLDPWGSAQERLCIGFLDVEVLEAANLPAADFGVSSDPYCTLELTGFYGESRKRQYEWVPELRLIAKTQVCSKTLHPIFRTRRLRFPVRRHGAVLRISLNDRDEIGADDPLGHLEISLNDLKPGEHFGWFLLHDPNDSLVETRDKNNEMLEKSNKNPSGPAVCLRMVFRVSPVGEFCSFLWATPNVVKPPPLRFDPNVFFGAAFSFKAKVITNTSNAIKLFLGAIAWKQPAFSITVFSSLLVICNSIEFFWALFHIFMASFVIATGILTDAGALPLISPMEIFNDLINERDATSFTEEVGVVTYEDSGCSASTERPASRSSKLFTGLKEMCVELSYVTGVAAA